MNLPQAMRLRRMALHDGVQPYVVLKNLKQSTRGRGRPRKDENQVPERIVPLTVCPKALRHSFAMHLFYSQTHEKMVQALMGHKKEKTTDIYIQVFALDVAADNQVQFTWEAGDARQLLLEAGRQG